MSDYLRANNSFLFWNNLVPTQLCIPKQQRWHRYTLLEMQALGPYKQSADPDGSVTNGDDIDT